jgi:glycosyltransferase involved in cell wall biosynthesis
MRTLMLSPEPPYPLRNGGAYRTASLLHYLAKLSTPDLVLFSETGQPSLLPPQLKVEQQVIRLPEHNKDLVARYLRNARRAIRGVPPLIDRLAGFESEIAERLQGRHYDLGVIEHFWCAPYVEVLRRYCHKVVLDLHNVESVLHERCTTFSHGAVKAGHRRFGAASRKLEAALFPRFALILATSGEDARMIRAISPQARVEVYPNAFPVPRDSGQKEQPGLVVFSGNFEYHPNIDAVEFLMKEIWPEVRRRHPGMRLRLVGRGDRSIRHLLTNGASDNGVETTGSIEDAFSEIAAAEIVIAPLRIGSGTRLKIIEAWAAARPVIATPLAAEGLNVRDGENIRLAGTATSIADAVDELLADSGLRQRLGAAGRETFRAHYSWEAAWAGLNLTRIL